MPKKQQKSKKIQGKEDNMKLIAENRRAGFEYELLEKYEAGIVLTGDEIKSVRMGHFSIVDCYGFIKNGECFLRNSYIKEYSNGNTGEYL